MFRVFFCLFISLRFFSTVSAQSQVHDFYVNYSVDIDSDQSMISLLSIGTSVEVAFKGAFSKTNIRLAGGSNKISMVADNNAVIATVLLDIVEGKKAFQMDASKRTEMETALQKIGENPMRYTDSYKNIAGYDCQKVFMKHLASGANIIVYLSQQLAPKQDAVFQAFYKQMKGFPLGVVVRKDATTVRIMATEVQTKLGSTNVFSTKIPEGYEKTTLEAIRDAAEKKYSPTK